MSVYSSADHLYTCLQALFAQIETADPEAAATLLKSRLCIRLQCSAPTAEVLLDARQRPLQIQYGRSDARPDLDIEITGAALHQILLGQLSLTKAMGSKQLKPKGPVWKAMALADLFRHAQNYYPEIFAAHH